MLAQTKFIEMKLVPAGSRAAREMFPELHTDDFTTKQQLEELTVIDNLGGVYRGGEAWVMCFYALSGYRSLALRLAEPELLPLARNAFSSLSRSRKTLSDLLGLSSKEELAGLIGQDPEPFCVTRPVTHDAAPDKPPVHAMRAAHESWLW
jgi:hypothetical protein